MREIPIQNQLIASLKWILGKKKQLILGIITPLNTEEKQTIMMNYLRENYKNKELMREDKLIKKSLEIAKKN